ncbi:hypothetical protein K7432_018151 [Basidiobolus ranarum]|uniref:Uncharacterized protein n=1 Tax=Basidiobolus ranarum TaxID=34480 RepID=A0ABR2WCI2_9FUNG
MIPANNLLLLLSSALLASSFVVERGYVPPTGISYCQDLLSHLRTRYGLNIGPGLCSSRPDKSDDGLELLNPADFTCDELAVRVRALGIHVDANVCLGNIVNESHRNAKRSEDDDERRCRDIVARLRLLKVKVDANVCVGLRGAGGLLSRNEINRMGCEALVVKARILNIIDADVNICLQNDREPRKLQGSNDDKYNECHDIVARLRLLGVEVDANLCLSTRGSKGWSKNHVNRLECDDIVAHAKVLGILKADADVCLRNGLNPGHSRRSNDEDYNECDDIVARLRLLGLKVNANVCLGIKGRNGWSKEYVDELECADIVAHAEVLGIIKADVNICLGNILNLGHSRGPNDNEEYNECSDIAAHLRLLGLKVDANVEV